MPLLLPRIAALVGLVVTIAACVGAGEPMPRTVVEPDSVLSVAERVAGAERMAALAGMEGRWLTAGAFGIKAYLRPGPAGEGEGAGQGPIRVYIEGDGYAWANRTTPSADPTPHSPVGLWLAVRDPGETVIYLARPCQYRPEGWWDICSGSAARYWTDARFAPEVIDSLALALDAALEQAGARGRPLVLVGFSGGAAVAALLAARREDVRGLISIAGVLGHGVWTQHHQVSPMTASLDPLDVAADLAAIPQLHVFGGRDTVVPAGIAEAWFAASGRSPCVRLERSPQATHTDGWIDQWPLALSRLPAAC